MTVIILALHLRLITHHWRGEVSTLVLLAFSYHSHVCRSMALHHVSRFKQAIESSHTLTRCHERSAPLVLHLGHASCAKIHAIVWWPFIVILVATVVDLWSALFHHHILPKEEVFVQILIRHLLVQLGSTARLITIRADTGLMRAEILAQPLHDSVHIGFDSLFNSGVRFVR